MREIAAWLGEVRDLAACERLQRRSDAAHQPERLDAVPDGDLSGA